MARKKNKVIETLIIDNIFPNKSVAEHEGKKVIFKGGIKGQKVRVALKKRKKDYIEGRLLEVLERSPWKKTWTVTTMIVEAAPIKPFYTKMSWN